MPRRTQHTVVLYDIPHDRARAKISDACLDFGLVRFQFSAFEGGLTRNRCEELALKLTGLMRDCGGRVRIMQVCRDDVASTINVEIDPPPPSRVAPDPGRDGRPRLTVFTGDEAT